MNWRSGFILAIVFCCLAGFGKAQDSKGKAKGKAKAPPKKKVVKFTVPPLVLDGTVRQISKTGKQIDFPAVVSLPSGQTMVAYLEWGGKSDSLRLARETDEGFEDVATFVDSGVLHEPALAFDGEGKIWCFWGETHPDDETVDLFAQSWSEEAGLGERIEIANTDASEAFVDAASDQSGRVWVTWQSLRSGEADIYARYFDPESEKWSDEIAVSSTPGGDWEPEICCIGDEAWILYDSSRDKEFNLYLARLSSKGKETEYAIAHSFAYEARGSMCPAADGPALWIAAERGKQRLGLDYRGHKNGTGINAGKRVLFGRFDLATESFTEIPLGAAGNAGTPVNLPSVGVGKDGSPWVAYRYYKSALWRIAVAHYRESAGKWSAPHRLENSSYGQDRPIRLFLKGGDNSRICWPSDRRPHKAHQELSVFLGDLPEQPDLPIAKSTVPQVTKEKTVYPPSQDTPERPVDDRHSWTVAGKTYQLFWGDVHRHTDISNCRTGFDGCIADHFRYAYDLAKLDFLGTSDHTDVGKLYHPYEWWHSQRMHDAFHSPRRFNSLYVYEREQPWPWGHRNVVFADRGGPVVYINRMTYRKSPWHAVYPVAPKLNPIEPSELWDVLIKAGKPVAVISHTGASRMGTDWAKYDRIDHRIENIVEIFQGARVAYEGEGAPQPTAGLMPKEPYTINGDAEAVAPDPIMDFGKYSAGTYQNALELGRKLGVFASSDHISQHTSYGGVFCEDFTREGIIEAMNSRRTIAATDRIYLNFTVNDQPLGSIFESRENAKLWFRVDGTAKLKRITIVRNEEDWKEFRKFEGSDFEISLVDDAMAEGENRYYVRVVQEDGNMAWSSPVWMTQTQ